MKAPFSYQEFSMMLERLEERIAPASVVTFQDFDGDVVTIKSSKGNLANADITEVAGEGIGVINLNGSQEFEGTNLTITVKENGGDGFVKVGYVNAWGISLGKVKIKGTLAEIDAGSGLTQVALKSLDVYGMQKNPGGNTSYLSDMFGNVGSLTVRGDVNGVGFETDWGDIGKVKISGSLIGENFQTGTIKSAGNIGSVKIGGNLNGELGGARSGSVIAIGHLSKISVGGSLLGGINNDTGSIQGASIGIVKVVGDINGGAATGTRTGSIFSNGDIKKVTVGGSLIGGTPPDDAFSDTTSQAGSIYALGNIGSVKIAGDVIGGGASSVGGVAVDSAANNGSIISENGSIKKVTIGGNLVAGTDQTTGTFENNGTIRAHWNIGSIAIKGNVVGNNSNRVFISAGGQETPSAKGDVAIKSIKIGGGVTQAHILAGFDWDADINDFFAGSGINADAQIGKVTVEGDWASSTIAAGAFFDVNTNIFQKLGLGDEDTLLSKITSLVIKGQATGFGGITAQKVGSVKVGGTTIDLQAGPHNDNNVSVSGDGLVVHEVAM